MIPRKNYCSVGADDTGTESETRAFMALCIETVRKFGKEDIRTPVFILRDYALSFTRGDDTKDFYLTLEKDNQQEDFLQGRMLGQPLLLK